MNQTRLDSLKAIRTVIEHDAEIQNEYCNEEGQTCVIGGLAKAKQIPLPANAENNEFLNTLPSFENDLLNAYPEVTASELNNLQYINDAYMEREERQAHLLKEVDSWIEETKAAHG